MTEPVRKNVSPKADDPEKDLILFYALAGNRSKANSPQKSSDQIGSRS